MRRFHAPDAPRRLLGRAGSDDFIVRRGFNVVMRLMWERRYYGLKVGCCQPISAVEGAMLGVRREGSGVWGSEQGKVQPWGKYNRIKYQDVVTFYYASCVTQEEHLHEL